MLSTFSIPLGLRLRLRPRQVLWLVYALFFVSGVAQAAIVPLLPRLAGTYDLSASETALLLALPGLATLAVSVPAGLAADRFGARRVTLAAGMLLCISCLAQSTPSLAVLLAGRIAFGVSFGVVWTTGMAWLSEIETGTKGGRLGPSVTCSSVGVMVGPAVGGILAQHGGLGVPFVAIAAFAALVVVPLGFGSQPDLARAQPERPRHSQAPSQGASIGALVKLLRRPGVAAAAGGLVVSGAVSGVSQLLITIGLHHGGVSTGKIGLAFSAAAICYIAVSASVVRLGKRTHDLRFNAAATLALALALVPALVGGGPPLLVLALVLSAMPRAAISTVAYSLASVPGDGGSESGDGEGFVFGMLNGGWAGAMVLMPLLAGALDQHDGARAGFLAVILPSVAIACWLIARARPLRGAGAEIAR